MTGLINVWFALGSGPQKPDILGPEAINAAMHITPVIFRSAWTHGTGDRPTHRAVTHPGLHMPGRFGSQSQTKARAVIQDAADLLNANSIAELQDKAVPNFF